MIARLWAYIIAALGVIAGLLYVRQSGKNAARADQARKTSEQRRRVNEADNKLVEMDHDDIRRELDKWVRRDGD